MPDLTDEQAHNLAKRFDFSGGQIENIARKRIVNDILNDKDDIDIDGIIEACEVELLNKKNGAKLGFVALPGAYFAYLIPCILLYMALATSLKKAYVRHYGELL